MKLKIGNYFLKLEPIPPEIGVNYYHKDQDPNDMIDYVIPRQIKSGKVQYTKVYKAELRMPQQTEICSLAEFNKWFRKEV